MQFLSNFFKRISAPTSLTSRREFTSLGPIAEPACTISNIPMLAVAFYYNDPTLMFAATASALSHAILNQGLHDLDMMGVALIGIKAIGNSRLILNNPQLLLVGAFAMAVNLVDTNVTRRYPELVGPWLHVAWHLMAAVAMQQFDSALNQEMQMNL
ncbi:hypothetical protein ACNVED_09210 [Legionella sp. D16C41]|uniref:hypothetical protein n=1 Tax=Legionella sp. D16C41 TaxID=3402688 RepID=UPI003AF6403C